MSESVSSATPSAPSAAASSRRTHLLRGVFAALAAALVLGGTASTADAEPQVVVSADGNDSFIWG
ncbi:hypothetical protein [Streptomyces sp. R41]|uniref:Uncharacterized protein n=1 Tax=Streptomyces sp. R41 TaxID=3238632 RepID=A0AB39RLX7_9ACTN